MIFPWKGHHIPILFKSYLVVEVFKHQRFSSDTLVPRTVSGCYSVLGDLGVGVPSMHRVWVTRQTWSVLYVRHPSDPDKTQPKSMCTAASPASLHQISLLMRLQYWSDPISTSTCRQFLASAESVSVKSDRCRFFTWQIAIGWHISGPQKWYSKQRQLMGTPSMQHYNNLHQITCMHSWTARPKDMDMLCSPILCNSSSCLNSSIT